MKKAVIFTMIGVIVALVVGAVIKVNQWIKNIKYGIADGVKLEGLSGSNVKVRIPLWIYNPSPVKIVASDLNLKVSFNGYPVSTIVSKSNYELTPQQNSTFPLMVNVRPMDVINLLAEQGTIIDQPDWLEKVNVRIKGTITLYIGIFTIRNYEIDVQDSLKSYVQ